MTAEAADPALPDFIDDSDLPLSEVVANYHDQGSEAETSGYIYTSNETGGLTSTAGAEDVLTEAVGGVDGVIPVGPGLTRRPHRMRRKNVLYQRDWWVDRGDEDGQVKF
jgi:hypothetical protein